MTFYIVLRRLIQEELLKPPRTGMYAWPRSINDSGGLLCFPLVCILLVRYVERVSVTR